MKKKTGEKSNDDLRPEYDLSKLKGGVRGKYYRKAVAGTNLVLIEPELSKLFPNAASVNRALRVLADTATATVRHRKALAATARTSREFGRLLNVHLVQLLLD